jgi:hypothetical protein
MHRSKRILCALSMKQKIWKRSERPLERSRTGVFSRRRRQHARSFARLRQRRSSC